MINVLNDWMLESTGNFNVIIGIIMAIFIISFLTLAYVGMRVGKPDERTNGIYLKIASSMFIVQVIMNAIFISLIGIEIEYFRQFFIMFQAIVFLIGAFYSFGLYRKDFK